MEEYYNENSERVLTYLNGDKPSDVTVRYKLSKDKQEYSSVSVEKLSEVVPPITSGEKINFYCAHAVKLNENNQITDVV